MKMFSPFTQTLPLILLLFSAAIPQSGGGYTITQSVISGGGGSVSGGGFTNDATTGESVSGIISSGGQFEVGSGFWGPSTPQGPTAAGVSVSGRVTTPDGRGLRNAYVTISDSHGMLMRALSSAFGYYAFDNIPAGQTYVMTVSSKLYRFPVQTVVVNDTVSGLNLVGIQ